MQIIIVEDEENIRKELKQLLQNAMYEVTTIESFSDVAGQITRMEPMPDLVLLDLNLPEESGFAICTKIREYSEIPVIFLTSRTDSMDELTGILKGADDYITKPFRQLVLGAKVKALIRRNKNLVLDNSDTLECGPFSYDTTTMRFYKNGEELILSSKESALLLLFMKHPQQVFTKDMIYEHVWGNTVAIDDNAIMVYINRLRGKIEDDRQNPAHILTIRGLGYRFVP